MPNISLKIDTGLLAQVDLLAKKQQTSRSECIRHALTDFIDESHLQYSGLPQELLEKVDFLMLLVLNGTPDKDWTLLQHEVVALWKTMQSSDS